MPASATIEKPVSRAVKIEPAKIKLPPHEDAREYHIGMLSGSPFHVLSVEGIAFPRHSDGHMPEHPRRPGNRVRLTDSHVERIKVAMGKTFVCGGVRPGKYVAGTPTWPTSSAVLEKLEPLAKYVYMREVPPEEAAAREAEPEAMAS